MPRMAVGFPAKRQLRTEPQVRIQEMSPQVKELEAVDAETQTEVRVVQRFTAV